MARTADRSLYLASKVVANILTTLLVVVVSEWRKLIVVGG